jgi:anti-anti-sigma factor
VVDVVVSVMATPGPGAPSVPPGMVRVSEHGGVLRVRVRGEIDLWLRADLQAALSAVRQHAGPVELDLGSVTFIGAEGVGIVLSMVAAHPPGRVVVVGTSPAADRTLRLCGITEDVLPRRRRRRS